MPDEPADSGTKPPAELREALWELRRRYGVDSFWRSVDAMPREAGLLDLKLLFDRHAHKGGGRKPNPQNISERNLWMMAALMADGMHKLPAARRVLKEKGTPDHLLENQAKVLARHFGTGKEEARRVAAARAASEALRQIGEMVATRMEELSRPLREFQTSFARLSDQIQALRTKFRD